MRIALIANGIVERVIVADSLDFARDVWSDFLAVPTNETEPVGPNCRYNAYADPRFISPEPQQPEIDWDGFRPAISAHPAYLRLASATPVNLALNSMLTALLWQVGSQPNLLGEVADKWNLMVSDCPLNPDEVISLNQIAEAYGMPLRLGAGGLIAP